MTDARRSPEQIIAHLEELTTAPNLAADTGPAAREQFVKGVARIRSEVLQLHTQAQMNRALLRVDIAMTQLRAATTATADERMKALQELRDSLASVPVQLRVQTAGLLNNPVAGYAGETQILANPAASATDRTRALTVLGLGALAGVTGLVMTIRNWARPRPANAPRESMFKRFLKAAAWPAATLAGVLLIGMAGRTEAQQQEAAARQLIGPDSNDGDIAGLRFERRPLTTGGSPETVISHNGVPYRLALRWPPARVVDGATPPPVREDNWSTQISTILDRGTRVNGGVGLTFNGGFASLGGQGETRIELAGLQQIATGMPLATASDQPEEIVQTVFLRFPLSTLSGDQRQFIQEQIRVGAPVAIEGNEIRVQATVVLRRVGAAPASTPSAYPVSIPTAGLDIRDGGEQTINLGTADATTISLSVPGQPLVSQSLPGTGTPSIVCGGVTLTRNGQILTVRPSATPPASPGVAVISIRRERDPSPRSVRVFFGPRLAEAPLKDNRAEIDPSSRRFTRNLGLPDEALTIGGERVLPGASRTPIGTRFLVSRTDGGVLTIEPANVAASINNEPLRIQGPDGLDRTLNVFYTPEAASAFALPPAISLTAAAPVFTTTTAPATALRVGTVTIPPETGTTAVTIGALKISRSNGGRTMTIEPVDRTRALTSQSLTFTGDGGISVPTAVSYTPAPAEIPALSPVNLSSLTPPRTTVLNMPNVALTANTSTSLPVDATNVAVPGSNLKISRVGTAMTVEVADPAVAITDFDLVIGGAGGIVSRTMLINYVPPSIPDFGPTTLSAGTRSREITGLPARVLRLTAPGTPQDLATNANVTVGNLRITRTNSGATLTIELVDPAVAVNGVDVTIGGTGLTARTTRVNYAPPAPGELPFDANITLTGTPPRTTVNGMPARALRVTSPGPEQDLPVNGSITVGNVRFTRATPGTTLTIEPANAATAVTDFDVTIGGTGVTAKTTRINYVLPAAPTFTPVNIRGDTQSYRLTGIPAGRLLVQGQELDINASMYLSATGTVLASGHRDIALTITRNEDDILLTADADKRITDLPIRIRRNGDSGDGTLRFSYTPDS